MSHVLCVVWLCDSSGIVTSISPSREICMTCVHHLVDNSTQIKQLVLTQGLLAQLVNFDLQK